MLSHLFTAHDSIYKQLNKISELTHDFKDNQRILEEFSQRGRVIQTTLPYLRKECEDLQATIRSLQKKINKSMDLLESHRNNLNAHIINLSIHDKKLSHNTAKIESLIKDRKKLIQILVNNNGLIQNTGELHFSKLGTKRSPEYSGLGLELLQSDSYRIDTQASAIESQIETKNKKAATLLDAYKDLERNALSQTTFVQPYLDELTQSLDRLKTCMMYLTAQVSELEALMDVSKKDDLHSAALSGDVEQIKRRLFLYDSPAAKDGAGVKPVYYACRAGHLQAARLLLDLTQLSEDELVKIIKKLPEQDKILHDALYAALQANGASYDDLWNDQKSYGDNIIRIFSDYYAPELWPSIPGISKEQITSYWHREHVQFAKDIVSIFKLFEDPLKQNQQLCQNIIDGKWATFFALNPNTTDTLARRLHYVKNKLVPRAENDLDESMVQSLKSSFNQHQQAVKAESKGFLSFLKSPFGFMNHTAITPEPVIDAAQVKNLGPRKS